MKVLAKAKKATAVLLALAMAVCTMMTDPIEVRAEETASVSDNDAVTVSDNDAETEEEISEEVTGEETTYEGNSSTYFKGKASEFNTWIATQTFTGAEMTLHITSFDESLELDASKLNKAVMASDCNTKITASCFASKTDIGLFHIQGDGDLTLDLTQITKITIAVNVSDSYMNLIDVGYSSGDTPVNNVTVSIKDLNIQSCCCTYGSLLCASSICGAFESLTLNLTGKLSAHDSSYDSSEVFGDLVLVSNDSANETFNLNIGANASGFWNICNFSAILSLQGDITANINVNANTSCTKADRMLVGLTQSYISNEFPTVNLGGSGTISCTGDDSTILEIPYGYTSGDSPYVVNAGITLKGSKGKQICAMYGANGKKVAGCFYLGTSGGELYQLKENQTSYPEAPTKYNITFYGNGATGGSTAKMTGLMSNKSYSLRANGFTKKGYNFLGWSTDPNATEPEYGNKAKITGLGSNNETVKLYAVWELATYSISYDFKDSENYQVTNKEEFPTSYQITDETIILSTPDRVGFTFKGWYTDAKFKNKITKIAAGSYGNKTLYAKWAANHYTVTFNKGTGAGKITGTTKNQSYAYGTAYYFPRGNFTYRGYYVSDWLVTDANGTVGYLNDLLTDGKMLDLSAEDGHKFTFTAQWTIMNWSITYNFKDSENYPVENPGDFTQTSYTVDDETITLSTPVRTGFKFLGWYSDAKFKNRVTSIPANSIGNKTFYAKWVANKYTVKFDKGTGAGKITGSMNTQSYAYGTEYAVPKSGFAQKGYYVSDWIISDENGEVGYLNNMLTEGKWKDLSSEAGHAFLFTAVWAATPYTITYVLNDKVSEPVTNAYLFEQITYFINEAEDIEIAEPEREGYDFAGWYTDKKLTKKVKSLTIPTGSIGNRTFYAKWKAHTYKLSFNANEGKGTMKDKTLVYGTSYSVPACTFTRAGYKFAGWMVQVGDSEYLLTEKLDAKNKFCDLTPEAGQVVTFVAQWEIIDYTITFVLNGTTAAPVTNAADFEGITYRVTDAAFGFATPVRPGYEFAGWYTDKKLTKRFAGEIAEGSTGNKTFYAKWKKVN